MLTRHMIAIGRKINRKQDRIEYRHNNRYNASMNRPLKLTSFGNSVGAVFPKDVLARLRANKGDILYLTEAPDGSFRLTPYDPEFEEQMQHAEAIMQEDR
ncbi:MAG: hypothetical protein AAGD40_08230, partial [Pseudomonadota bacterium]